MKWMSILHSHFIGNFALAGGGLTVITQYFPSNSEMFQLYSLLSTAYVSEHFQLNTLVSTVQVQNTTFTDIAAWSGSAVYVTHAKLNSLAVGEQQQFILENTSFHHNHRNIGTLRNENILGYDSTVYFMYIQHVTISNCEFLLNNGTALTAEHSNIIFSGDVIFRENLGTSGGAIRLF